MMSALPSPGTAAFTSAPRSSSMVTMSRWPRLAAMISALPSPATPMSASAPRSSSRRTRSRWPLTRGDEERRAVAPHDGVDVGATVEQFGHLVDVALLCGLDDRDVERSGGGADAVVSGTRRPPAARRVDGLIRNGRHTHGCQGQDEDARRGHGCRHQRRASAAAKLRAIEHGPDAHREVAAIGHRQHRLRLTARQPLRQRHQLFRVVGLVGPVDHGIVAGALALETELAPGDPDERMKPVAGADRACRQLHRPITPADVFELVDEGAPQIGVAPVAGVRRKHDGWTAPPEGDRSRHILVQDDGERPADARLAGQRLRRGLPREPRDAAAANRPHLPERVGEKREQQHGASRPQQPERGRNRHPGRGLPPCSYAVERRGRG